MDVPTGIHVLFMDAISAFMRVRFLMVRPDVINIMIIILPKDRIRRALRLMADDLPTGGVACYAQWRLVKFKK